MSTEAIAGFEALVWISTDGGTSYNIIAELKDVTITIERDTIDASHHKAKTDPSYGWKENIDGLAQWTASAEYLHVKSDAQQAALYQALIDRTLLKFKFTPEGDKDLAGDLQWDGDGRITSWELAGPNDDAAASSVEILGSGVLAKSTIT